MGLTHRHERKRKQQELNNIIERCKEQQVKTVELIEALHSERLLVVETIKNVEAFVNSLKNTPENFKKEMKAVKLNLNNFDSKIRIIQEHLESSKSDAKHTAMNGVITGFGIGTLVPSTAVAVASTFGTASTGVAISSLSGVAASNATLSCLGGGALSAGGGGVAGGKALLALTRTLGWSVAGVSILASIIISAKGNRSCIREANTKISEISIDILELQKIFAIVDQLKKETCNLRESTENLLKSIKKQDMENMLKRIKESNEILLTDKNLLNAFGKLINLTNALSVLIVKDVEVPNEQ